VIKIDHKATMFAINIDYEGAIFVRYNIVKTIKASDAVRKVDCEER